MEKQNPPVKKLRSNKTYVRSWKKLFLIYFLIAIFLFSLVYYFTSKQKTKVHTSNASTSPSQSPTANKTASNSSSPWRTYRNPKLGFTIDYPGSWVEDKQYAADAIQFISPDDKSIFSGNTHVSKGSYLYVRVNESEHDSYETYKNFIEDALATNSHGYTDNYDFKEEVVLDDTKCLYIRSSSVSKTSSCSSWRNGKTYYLEFENEKNQYELFDKILSTFKFIDQDDSANTEGEIRRDFGYDQKYNVNIGKIVGSYASASISSIDGSFSGYVIYVVKKNDKWVQVWRGQNTPKCSDMIKYKIPNEIYGDCRSDY